MLPGHVKKHPLSPGAVPESALPTKPVAPALPTITPVANDQGPFPTTPKKLDPFIFTEILKTNGLGGVATVYSKFITFEKEFFTPDSCRKFAEAFAKEYPGVPLTLTNFDDKQLEMMTQALKGAGVGIKSSMGSSKGMGPGGRGMDSLGEDLGEDPDSPVSRSFGK